MSSSSGGYRNKLIRFVTFIGGLYFFLEFLLPKSILAKIGAEQNQEAITNGFIVVSVMAIGLGLINLIRNHGLKIAFIKKGWIHSFALLAGLFLMMVVTVMDWSKNLAISRTSQEIGNLAAFAERIEADEKARSPGVKPVDERIALLKKAADENLRKVSEVLTNSPGVDSALSVKASKDREELQKAYSTALGQIENIRFEDLTRIRSTLNSLASAYGSFLRDVHETSRTSQLYKILFDGLFVSLGSAMFALLGVYIASAAYRAFRVRSIESSLMMIAGILVMLGQIPQGKAIYSGLPEIRQWLLEVPNSAAFRAIRLGAAVAGLIMAIRMWLSIESRSFSSKVKR